MKKNAYRIGCIAAAAWLLGGCGDTPVEKEEVQEMPGDAQTCATEQKEVYLSAEEDMYVPTVVEMFAEEEPYPELADFLVRHYQVPEEAQSETRYYYNYIDLDDDGTMEIFAMVLDASAEVSSGNPAVVLSVDETGAFAVEEDFASIRTPVTISEQKTNGRHDIIYYAYGRDAKDGYRICRYNPEGGYQTDISEIVDTLEPVGGMQILSNNLIDDMDQGRYLTLAPQTEEEAE